MDPAPATDRARVPRDSRWHRHLAALVEWKVEHGFDADPPLTETRGGVRLGAWCARQRVLRDNHMLSVDRIRELNDAAFDWDPYKSSWKLHFEALEAWKRKHE